VARLQVEMVSATWPIKLMVASLIGIDEYSTRPWLPSAFTRDCRDRMILDVFLLGELLLFYIGKLCIESFRLTLCYTEDNRTEDLFNACCTEDRESRAMSGTISILAFAVLKTGRRMSMNSLSRC